MLEGSEAEREKPRVIFQLTRGSICMTRHHQISRLSAERQGEVSYETAAKRPDLVRINRVFNAVNIHIPDPEIAVRNPL
jgi:hypothetical protein